MTTETSAVATTATVTPAAVTTPATTEAVGAATQTSTTLLGGTAQQSTATQATATAEAGKAAETNGAQAPITGAPDKYADFTMPEGVTVDAKAVESFAPVLKGLNLNQDQAQQLVSVYATEMQRQATDFGAKLKDPAFATEQAGAMLAQHRDAWATAVRTDTEIGGTNFDANVQTAQRAVARFGTPELKSLLETTGLGNHPALVKMFVSVGKQIREDSPNYGGGGSARKSNVDVFYGGSAASGA